MVSRISIFALALVGLPIMASADDYIPPVVGGKTYVQHQIVAAKTRHPEILSIIVEGKRDSDKSPVVLGSTRASGAVFTAAPKPAWDVGGKLGPRGRTYVVRTPFVSSTDHPIGTIVIAFAYRKGQSIARLDGIARAVSADMARATLSAKNAAEFLLLDRLFPRSIIYSISRAEDCMSAIDPRADRVGEQRPGLRRGKGGGRPRAAAQP